MESARVDVLGVQVSAVNQSMALEAVTDWTRHRDRQYVCVTGVHGVMESVRDPELRDIHNRSGMTTPDGMPMVWAGRRAGAGWMDRVYGPDLMLAVCERAAVEGWSSYFYGAAPGVADKLATRLSERFPGLRIVGTHSPPFRPLTEDEAEAEIAMINTAAPDLVWVGLSTPKQEKWMARRRHHLDAPVLLGVGAAFDINAGLVAQAPDWMQRSGLEWAFRLGKEPRRLWRRYLRNNPSFVVRIVRHPPKLVV